jgi:hypothetical protein
MNGLEIIGKAAIDAIFRGELFSNVEGIIARNSADLTPEQQDGLRRIVQQYCPSRNGTREQQEENTLNNALDAVGRAVHRMCPQEPCGWP